MTFGTYLRLHIWFIVATCMPLQLFASPSSFTYQGRILKTDGTPLEYNNVSFAFEITNASGNCVLYREQRDNINMQGSKGIFDVPIGSGSRLYPTSPSYDLRNAFNNSVTHTCEGGSSYVASANDIRILKVQFHDGTGWKAITPNNEIRSVPFATSSYSAAKLGDKLPGDFVLRSAVQSCLSGQYLTFDGTNFSCQNDAGGAGMVSDMSVTGPYLTKSGTASIPNIGINVGTTAGTVAAGDDSRFTNSRPPNGAAGGDLGGTYPNPSVTKLQAVPVSSVAPTSGHFLKFDGTQWLSSAIAMSDVTNLNSTLSNYHTVAAFNSAVGSANCAAHQTPYWNSVSGSFQCQAINVSVAGDVSGTIGAVSVNKIKGVDVDTTGLTSGQVLKYDGIKWAPAVDSNAGGTVTNIATGTGLTGGPITSTGTIALANTAVTAGSYTRANITVDAQGRLTSASNGAAVNLASEVTGTLPIANGGTGQTTALAAFNALSPLTIKGDVLVRDGTNNIRLPVGTDGQVLSANSVQASGLQWITPTNGTVTNVTGTAPIVVATGSTTPAISISDATTAAKGAVQVGAGIAVSAGTISADPANFPSAVPVSKGGTGVTSLTANRLLASNGTGSAVTIFNCAVGQMVSFDATGMMICSSFTTGSVFLNGGNSYAGDATLGTNDNYALNFETNGTTKMTVLANGNVGIGASTPGVALEVAAASTGRTKIALDNTNTSAGGSRSSALDLNGYNTAGTTLINRFEIGTDYELNGTNSLYVYDSVAGTNRMYISSAGNVGVGTSNPTAKIHIEDTGTESVRINSASAADREVIFSTGGVARTNIVGANSTAESGSNAGSDFQINTYNDAGAYQATPFFIKRSSGNVGIGTTAPAHKLTLGSGHLAVEGGNIYLASGNSLQFNYGVANDYGIYKSGTNLLLTTGGSFSFSGGNVGIGTASPDRNTVIVESTGGNGRGLSVRTFNSTNTGGVIEVAGGLGTPAAPLALTAGMSLGFYTLTGYDGTSVPMQATPNGMYAHATENWSSTAHGASLKFATTPNGTTNGVERMRIDQNGYVGIGVLSPVYRLHVSENAPGGYTGISNENTAAGGMRWSWLSSSTGASLGANSMCFEVGGFCRMSLTSAGNMTIGGTLTQSSDLRLKKNVRVIAGALDSISRLQGVTYDWNDPERDSRQQVGLIAQNVEKVYPQAVRTDSQGFKSVAYQVLVAPIINAVHELRDWLLKTDARVQALEADSARLKAQVEKAEKENVELKARLDKIEKNLNSK